MTAAATSSTLPADLGCLEAERALLGWMMVAPLADALAASALVTAADFVDPRHRLAFEALRSLVAEGISPEPHAILGRLQENGQVLGSVPSRTVLDILLTLDRVRCVGGSVRTYARTILTYSYRRRHQMSETRRDQAAASALPLADLHQLAVDEHAAVLAAWAAIDRAAA